MEALQQWLKNGYGVFDAQISRLRDIIGNYRIPGLAAIFLDVVFSTKLSLKKYS
jgi:hypothetical protein